MRRYRTVVLGACVASVVLTGTAGAKYPRFELDVSATSIGVAEPVQLQATVDEASWGSETGIPEPPVEIFRTEDMPALSPDDGLVGGREIDFTPRGHGVFHASVTFDEPGSYQIVSLGIWGHTTSGYPSPVEVVVREAVPVRATSPTAGDDGITGRLSVDWVALAVAAVATAAAYLSRRRRSRPSSSEPATT